MLLRSLTKHVKDQNWFAVALDFFIVVAGILIAFQITNWNEGRGSRALEKQYISLLAQDLDAIERTLEVQLAHEQSIVDAIPNVLAEISGRANDFNPHNLSQSLMLLWGRRSLTLESPTFSELKSAGRLTVIRDAALRNEIITYFDGLPRVQKVIEANNEFYAEPYGAFLRESGIGFAPISSENCNREINPINCSFSEALASAAKGEKTHSTETILGVPKDDPFWALLRSQTTYRAMGAIGSLLRAEATLEDTQILSDKLRAQ